MSGALPADFINKGNRMITEFREFIMCGNVVDLAVGIIIGAAFTAVVSSLANDLATESGI